MAQIRTSLADWLGELVRGWWAVVGAISLAVGLIGWAVWAGAAWSWLITAGLVVFLGVSFGSYHRVRVKLDSARQVPPAQQHYHYHYTFDQPPLHFPPQQPDTRANRPLFDQDDAGGKH